MRYKTVTRAGVLLVVALALVTTSFALKTGMTMYFNINDVTAPTVLDQSASTTNQSAIINIIFNEPANITILYGATIFFGGTAYNTSHVINQRVFLGSLSNNTLYYYNITACDMANNCQTMSIQTFITRQNNSTTKIILTTSESANVTISNGTTPSRGGGGEQARVHTITPEICVPNWHCADAGGCVNGIQQRDCVDFKGCNNNTGRPPLAVPCVAPLEPEPSQPETSGQHGGTQGGSVGLFVAPELVVPAVPVESIGQGVPAPYTRVFLTILPIILLVLTTGTIVLVARRKEEEENFYGVELEKDTTYVHYDFVVEALEVLEKRLDGQPVDDHTPFVQVVCREALGKAQANIVTARIPRERLDGQVDWVSAEVYSRVVDMLAAALIADVPITMTEDGHMHVVGIENPPVPAESYVDLSAPAMPKMPLTQLIVQERRDVLKVLEALREGETMLMLDVRYADRERVRFMKAVKKTVDVHNGSMLAVGEGKYVVTSGIPIDTSEYVRPEDGDAGNR